MSNDEGMTKPEISLPFEHSTFIRHSSFVLRHSPRISRMPPRPDDEPDADRNREEGKELTAGKHSNQRRVRLPKIFHDDPEDRVNDEKQTRNKAVWSAEAGADKPEDREENRAFERRFVKLRRMARGEDAAQSIGDLGIRADGIDDRIDGPKRRIDLLAGSERAIGFRGVAHVEQFL